MGRARAQGHHNILASRYGPLTTLSRKQIVGAPDQLFSEKFDVTAKPDTSGRPSLKQAQGMTRQLLVDRFQLKFITTRKRCLRTSDCDREPPKDGCGDDLSHPGGSSSWADWTLDVQNAPMLDFTQLLQASLLHRSVVDEMGPAGRWVFG